MDLALAKSHKQLLPSAGYTLDIGTELATNISHMDFIRSY